MGWRLRSALLKPSVAHLVFILIAAACSGASPQGDQSAQSPSSVTVPRTTAPGPSPTDGPLQRALRNAEMPEKPTGRLIDVKPGPATEPAMAPLYQVESEIDRLYDESVRLARGRDPNAQLVAIDIDLVFSPEANEFLFLTLAYFSPLDDAIFGYRKNFGRHWQTGTSIPLPVPSLSTESKIEVTESGFFQGLIGTADLKRPGVLPWTAWRGADLGRALFILWDKAERPKTYFINGGLSVLEPYELMLFMDDHQPPNARGLDRIMTVGGDYYVCLGQPSFSLALGGMYCATPAR